MLFWDVAAVVGWMLMGAGVYVGCASAWVKYCEKQRSVSAPTSLPELLPPYLTVVEYLREYTGLPWESPQWDAFPIYMTDSQGWRVFYNGHRISLEHKSQLSVGGVDMTREERTQVPASPDHVAELIRAGWLETTIEAMRRECAGKVDLPPCPPHWIVPATLPMDEASGAGADKTPTDETPT